MRRWSCTWFATPLPLKGKSRISLVVELSSEPFTVTAARPYVSFVSYFRNDGSTSAFDLRVTRAKVAGVESSVVA